MSQASDAIIEGFDALLESNGEEISFRGRQIRGLVNRNPFDRAARDGASFFTPRDNSEIRIRLCYVDSVPQANEEFIDEFGYSHRITSIKRLGEVVNCICNVAS